MTTYEGVHAGDVVLGYDNQLWGVAEIQHEPVLSVTFVRHGTRMTGYPPAQTPVTVVTPANMSAEARTAQMFIDAGLPVSILGEVIR